MRSSRMVSFLLLTLTSCAWAQTGARPQDVPRPKRVADRKWWLWTTIEVGSMVADVELTQACIRTRTCHEFDPVVGQHRWRAYAVSIPVHGLLVWKSYQRKKHESRGEQRAVEWWMLPLAATVVHGAGIAYTGAQGFRSLPSLPPCPPLPLDRPMRCNPESQLGGK